MNSTTSRLFATHPFCAMMGLSFHRKSVEVTQERFNRISELFRAALEHEPPDRPEYVRKACAGDEDLRKEVGRLLEAVEHAGDCLLPSTETGPEPYPVMEEGLRLGLLLKERYRIDSILGSGGFGIVYLGRDTELHGRPVVIKILREQVEREWFHRRFEEECKALARIRHPGVVGV